MFDYNEKLIAPLAVEFQCQTNSNIRVVRVYLNYPTAQILAFNESNGTRTAATLWQDEVTHLIDRARQICQKDDPE